MAIGNSDYPVRLEIDPATSQNRLTVLFRPILTIPHWIALTFLGIVAFAVWLLASFSIVLTARYPRMMLRFSIGLARWAVRVAGYGGTLSSSGEILFVVGGFLTDRYPPFSLGEYPEYPVRLIVEEQVEGRNRLTGFFLVRIIFSLPHAIILTILGVLVALMTIVAWIVGIILGRMPEWLHNLIAGYTRWSARVGAYGGLLVDEYPPFSFK